MSGLCGSALVFIFAVALHTVSALQCWKCSSDIDYACRDTFNGSVILARRGSGGMYDNYHDPNFQSNPNYNQNYNPNFTPLNSQTPALEICDDNEASLRRMRNVCIKKTIRGSGYVSIVRRCAMIALNENVGTCHDPVSRGLSLEFCQYCDYDGCNSATGLKTNIALASISSLVLILFFRK